MTRRPLVLTALALAVLTAATSATSATSAPSATPAAAPAVPPTFVLSGGGFGHGVGMSQYGAQAQALAGRSATEILTTYYTGTALRAVRDDALLRVQVLGDAESTRLVTSSDDAAGGHVAVSVRTSSGTRVLRGSEGDVVAVTSPGSSLTVSLTHAGRTTAVTGSRALVTWQGTRDDRGPATVLAVKGASEHLRWGRLEITNVFGLVNAVNVVRLHDEYLKGIDEVPASWAPAALQAQAIAARTYAIKALSRGVSRWCDCHVYDDTRSQVFHGWDREGAATWGARWAAAVRATAPGSTTGRVVTYGGTPIDATYFSSDGGRTENAQDVWGNAVPYLRSVPDPWSAGGGNPLAGWSRTRTQAQVAAAFGLPDVVALDLSDRTAGGGVRTAVATSRSGRTARISGGRLASRLSLPAWWVARPASRSAGADRWATALAAAPAPPKDGTVVVTAGDPVPVEAAVAAPLAHHLRAPLLLVTRDVVPAAVTRWLAGHRVARVLVVGSADVVSDAVVTALTKPGISVTRIGGADRYATAALVAQQIGAPAGAAVVAPGDSTALPTAIAAAAVAAATDRPLLLVQASSVPPATAAAVTALKLRTTVCVGPVAQLSEAVRAVLPSCTRAGADPADPAPAATAASLVRALDRTLPLATVAVAAPGVRQLSDAVAAASLGLPVLFAGPTAAPAATTTLLQHEPGVTRLRVFGGTPSVSAAVVTLLRRS